MAEDAGTETVEDELITVAQMAELLKISRASVYEHVHRGTFDECLVKVGEKTIRFRKAKVLARIEAGGFGCQD